MLCGGKDKHAIECKYIEEKSVQKSNFSYKNNLLMLTQFLQFSPGEHDKQV